MSASQPKRKGVARDPDESERTEKRCKSERSASAIPPHRYILAPMVGASELAFRQLVRRYSPPGLLAYTPMMNAARFAMEPAYRTEIFSTVPEDRPLVAHFAANDPQQFLAAAKIVEPIVDAIDLNLGCPQRIAHSGHYGSFLLDDVDRPLVLDMIRTLAQTLTIPVFAKIRLLSTTEKTIELVTQLRDAGASLVAIHARHRVNLVGRMGQGARDGPALLDEVAKVRAAVPGVRLISNGNVRTWEDVVANMEFTGADGIMTAEGILDDPAIFFPGRSSDLPASSVLPTTGAHVGAINAVAAVAAVAAGSASGSVAAAAASLSEGGLSEEERRVRKLTKKLREVERLEAAALAREGGSASLTKEEALKVAQKADTVAELAKAEKALKKLRKKRKLSEATEAGSTAAPRVASAPSYCVKPLTPRVASAPSVAEPAEPPRISSLAPQLLAQKPSPLQLAREYMELTKTHPVPLKTLVFHVRRMAKEPLTRFQLFSDVLEAKDAATVHAAVQQALDYEVNGFTPDPDKAKKERAAWELKKWREATRKRFEERMVRKALRSGLPHDHFLSQGAKVPTWQDLAELKAMDPAAAWSQWTSLHGQHCWAMHMDPGGCTRERTCAFLHVDVPKEPMDTSADHWG